MSEKKPREKKPQINVILTPELEAEITAFVQNAGPTLRKAIDSSTVLASGKPHGDDKHSFVAYAIRTILKKDTQQPAGRVFGTGIEKTVLEIMDRNIVAHENGEPWNVQTIGLSVLRDANHNHHSCQRWLEENGNRLAEHYASVGIKPEEVSDWNRKQGRIRAKLESEKH